MNAARHAAGPNSIDGDPQEFYLRHEVLAAIRKYREVYDEDDNAILNEKYLTKHWDPPV